jgi:hypothetical protein
MKPTRELWYIISGALDFYFELERALINKNGSTRGYHLQELPRSSSFRDCQKSPVEATAPVPAQGCFQALWFTVYQRKGFIWRVFSV